MGRESLLEMRLVRGVPGDPVVRTVRFHHKGLVSIPDWETKILQGTRCGQKNQNEIGKTLLRESFWNLMSN